MDGTCSANGRVSKLIYDFIRGIAEPEKENFKIIHVPRSKISNHACTNNCTIIIYNNIQTGCKPPICFGLFRPASERYSKRKIQ